MAHYIVSTASAPMKYVVYEQGKGNTPKAKQMIRIEGYANVANKLTLSTPNCAITEISDEEWELLQKNSSFAKHVQDHFMFHTEVADARKAVADMEKKDNSAQIRDDEFAQGLDTRFSPDEGMGMCKAKAGFNDSLKGRTGFQFVRSDDD